MLYLNISTHEAECHVGLSTLMEAYIFSLETIVRAALVDPFVVAMDSHVH